MHRPRRERRCMNFVHEDPDFGHLLEIVSRQTGISAALVEKDYWVTHTLWALHETGLDIWFKGGTRCHDQSVRAARGRHRTCGAVRSVAVEFLRSRLPRGAGHAGGLGREPPPVCSMRPSSVDSFREAGRRESTLRPRGIAARQFRPPLRGRSPDNRIPG